MHTEHRDWARAIKGTAVSMAYVDDDRLHARLVKDGFTPEESHWIVQAAKFYAVQRGMQAPAGEVEKQVG